ncbi:3673_t:CDS:2 [Funneliformis caledonium]|uniref:3673_t:CDS:1 n=1 Tax=Funneliformis caledonium TaxID=1117310 RepID=A0A9N9B7S8_9GLOM|nr:3673_t:CDS:2 [Funneliformis caledonium]
MNPTQVPNNLQYLDSLHSVNNEQNNSYHPPNFNTQTDHSFTRYYHLNSTLYMQKYFGDSYMQNQNVEENLDDYYRRALFADEPIINMEFSNQHVLFTEEPNINTEFSNDNLQQRTRWDEEDIKKLLNFLKDRSVDLKRLIKERGGCGSNVKRKLWDDASNALSKKFLPKQCDDKWKNIKRAYKLQPNIKFNKDIKEILK